MSSQPSRSSEDRQEGVSKIMKRMKSALKKGSNRSSISSESSRAAEPTTTTATTTTPAGTSRAPAPAPASAPTATATNTATTTARARARVPATATTTNTTTTTMRKTDKPAPVVPMVISNWSAVQEDRARVLFAKYGLSLEPGEWQSPADMAVQRIDRPVRMRVRRYCHRCQTTFSADRVCVNCQHVRCKKCPRHGSSKFQGSSMFQNQVDPPIPATMFQEQVNRPISAPRFENQLDRPITARVSSTKANQILAKARGEDKPASRKEPQLTLPSPTGGQDLVHRKPRQRVRRFCHMCQTMYANKSKECANCSHIRCKKCPRDPPNLKKYPNGYPGDAEPPFERQERVYKKPRRRVRYTCHKCSTEYAGSKVCTNCGQEKCEETIRNPPKKTEKQFDPEVVKSVEAKLAQLSTSA